MADRIFSAIALLVVLGYGIIAFTAISAPFQYDPLGPETWPRILSIVTACCLGMLLWKPDVFQLDIAQKTLFRVVVVTALLFAYASLYEDLGFIIATTLFCGVFAILLGADRLKAVVFGVAAGVLGYGVCAKLLELNLPGGLLGNIL
jgi:putative tricarboxylic transport membrane protein